MIDRNVAVVYTGGTLGMERTERGYSPSPNLAALLEAKIPELGSGPLPNFEVITLGDPADSADFTPRTWYDLASLIREEAPVRDGIVVIHGTDTMAYTASALSFLLDSVATPVVLTGSQLPLGELRSDARTNLLTALEVASSGRILEVAICFGHAVLRGNRATKVQSVSFDAFASPNFPRLASVGADVRYHDVEALPGLPPDCAENFTYRPANIVVLPVHPGLDAQMLRSVAQGRPDAVVLECYGAGTFPSRNHKLLAVMEEMVDVGTVVVALSQCLTGGADLDRYAAGRSLIDCGVVTGLDMTREAAYTKLHFLHNLGLAKSKRIQYLSRNLCGELDETRVA